MRREIVIIAGFTALGALAACGSRDPVAVVHEGLHTASAQLSVADAVAARGGYESGRVEVLVSREKLRILIEDARLAEADSAAHAAAAAQAVAAAETTLASDPEFPAIRSISVAIVHPATLRGGVRRSHTEEVFEFERGGGAAFAPPTG